MKQKNEIIMKYGNLREELDIENKNDINSEIKTDYTAKEYNIKRKKSQKNSIMETSRIFFKNDEHREIDEKYLEKNSLNLKKITQINNLDLLSYKNFIEQTPFRYDYIHKYINWYLSKNQSHYLANQIEASNYFFLKTIAISPDQKRIASDCYDNSIIIWDLKTKKLLLPPLKAHTNKIRSLIFSSHGVFASASKDSTIIIWDLNNCTPAFEPLKGHKDSVRCIAFSSDGSQLVSGGKDKNLLIWNTNTGRLLTDPMEGHQDTVLSVGFCQDGSKICSGGKDKIVIIWDSESLTILSRLKGHRADVLQTIFSPNSDYIASCGKDKTVILWDINSTRNFYELKGHKDFVRSIDFSADGTKLVSTSMKTVITWDTSFSKGLVLFKTVFDECDSLVVRFANDDKHIYVISSDKSLFILDGVNGETISRPISVFSASAKLNKISISTNDKHIACSTEDNQIVLYDSNDFVPLIKTMKKQTDLITCLSLSKKGNFMASGSQDNTLLIWDISNKDLRTVGPLKGHTKTLTALAFTDDEKKIASAGKDYIIIIWDTISGDILLDSLKKHSDTINVLEFSRDSEKLASGSKDGNIIIWNLINGEMLNRLKGFGASIKSLLFSKFNGVFLSGDSKGNWILWNIFHGKILHQGLDSHKKSICCFAFSQDETKFATGGKDCSIRIWDTKSGNLLYGPLLSHQFPILMINFLDKDQVIMTRSIESYKKWRISSFLSQKKYELEDVMDVSPNGKQILSSGEEGLGLKLSDAKTMQLLFKTYKEFNKPIVFAKFNYNGNHFIVGCKEKVISLWETKNLKKIQILNAHTAEVNCAVFSHNCQLIASGSADKTIILWDILTGKVKLGPLKAHEDEVKCIDFSQDDMRLVSGSEDYKIIIWNCVLGIPIMELLEGHQAGINFVRYSFDSRVIFSVGSDNRIVSWSAESGEILNKNLSENNIYGFDVSMNDEKIIYGGPNKKALIWDYRQFEGRQFCRKISFQNDILKVFWRNEADLFIVFENEIKIYFEFYRDESFFFENGLMLCQFYSNPESLTTEEFLRICNGKEGEIYPFFYNFLHVVAYTDDYNSFFEKKLSELLKKKGVKLNFEAFFELDIHGKSCYDIIIEKKNRNLIKMIFHYIAKNYTPNELMKFDFLNKITIKMMNQIIEVFGKDTSLLSELLTMCFQPPLEFPERFYHKELSNSFFFTANEPKITAKELSQILKEKTNTYIERLFNNTKISNTNEVIRAKTVFIKDILNTGNSETLLFFEKISNLWPDNNIFDNNVLAKIINYKWEAYGRKSFFKEFIVFSIYLAIYLANFIMVLPLRMKAEDDSNSGALDYYVSISLVLDAILLLFSLFYAYEELWQMRCLKINEYLGSLWNIIDIFLILLIMASIVIDTYCCFAEIVTNFSKAFYSITVFISFIRLISFARGLEKSAFMVRLIIQVISDIRYFLLLMIVFIFSLDFSSYLLQNKLEDNRFHNFGTYFRLMLGDFNYLDEMKVDYIFLFWVLFFISSIVLSIVLINLLIAIISNTFSKVSGSEKLTRNYELCNIMYQIDACEKQNEKEEKYLIHMYNDFHEKNENESEFNKIKYFIKRNKNLVKNVESLVIQNIKIHEDNNKKFNLFLDENKKKEN